MYMIHTSRNRVKPNSSRANFSQAIMTFGSAGSRTCRGKGYVVELFLISLKATWCPLTSATVEDNSQDVPSSFLAFVRRQPQLVKLMQDIQMLPAPMTAKDCLTHDTNRPPHNDKRSLRDCSSQREVRLHTIRRRHVVSRDLLLVDSPQVIQI